MTSEIKPDARLSDDRQYRYKLTRIWDEGKELCQFICLNPSTADETFDDQTIRRCIKFAQAWGFGGLVMSNLFAFRATKPSDMIAHYDALQKQNPQLLSLALQDNWMQVVREAKTVGKTVCGWGVDGRIRDAGATLLRYLRESDVTPYCLAQNKDGSPKHPLYVAGSAIPEELK